MTDEVVNISAARDARGKSPDEPEHLATVGGIIDETGVALAIYGDELDPEEVSRIFGATPTHAHRKGESTSSRSSRTPRDTTWKSGAWILEVRGEAPREPEEMTTALLDQLPEDEAIWAELATRFDIQLRYGLHMEAWNRGFDLSPALVARVARMHARLNFDIYAYLGEEES